MACIYLTTQSCFINKKQNDTWLKITWDGNLRIWCTFCCMRWYFTVDGDECSDPAPIDTIVFQQQTLHIIRQTGFSGVCKMAGLRPLKAGPKRIQLKLMECRGFGGYFYDSYTGFNSASRIIVEEVPPPGTPSSPPMHALVMRDNQYRHKSSLRVLGVKPGD